MCGRRSHQTLVEEGFEMPECWVGCLLPLATVKEPRMMAGPTVGETQHLMTVGETQHLSLGGWWGSRQATMMERRDFQLGAGVSKEGHRTRVPDWSIGQQKANCSLPPTKQPQQQQGRPSHVLRGNAVCSGETPIHCRGWCS